MRQCKEETLRGTRLGREPHPHLGDTWRVGIINNDLSTAVYILLNVQHFNLIQQAKQIKMKSFA